MTGVDQQSVTRERKHNWVILFFSRPERGFSFDPALFVTPCSRIRGNADFIVGELASPTQVSSPAPRPVGEVLARLARHPVELLFSRWNWKSALWSALWRGAIFLAANRRAGWQAASAAVMAEAAYRAFVSGVHGAFAQALRHATPWWLSAAVIVFLLPAALQLLEFIIHWAGGTPHLLASVLWSTAFTAVSSLFNWYAMRRGVMLVGEEGRPLADDVRAFPRVVAAFLWDTLRLLGRCLGLLR
jgi:hypothetical protein